MLLQLWPNLAPLIWTVYDNREQKIKSRRSRYEEVKTHLGPIEYKVADRMLKVVCVTDT